MDPITIIGYIIAVLVVVLPTAYAYSRKLGLAMTYIYQLLNIISSYLKGDLDHEWTDDEKLKLADDVITLGHQINNDVNINAVLNFFKK